MPTADARTVTHAEHAPAAHRTVEDAPGLVLLFCDGQPAYRAASFHRGAIVLGRAPGTGVLLLDDDRVSRAHARVEVTPAGFHLTDLRSRNGTFVDGARADDAVLPMCPILLRAGKSLVRLVPGLAPYLRGGVERHGSEIVGPVLRAVRDRIAAAAAIGEPVLLTGASGSGKELAARHFHRATGRKGPFIAVNCATLAPNLAERMLFGARRGAYSGAVENADGHVQAAEGGTLFLDEIAELDPAVQPKLLRLLDYREATPLGAAKPRVVDVRVCAATLKDLRAEVAAGRFRADLYYRLGRPEIRIPSLADRVEEIPWILCDELARVDPAFAPTVELVEACALRPWPGNVRDLLFAARDAARSAREDGRDLVDVEDLAPDAGQPLAAGDQEPGGRPSPRSRAALADVPAALTESGGNVTAAARLLGWHRNQLRRWLKRKGIDPNTFRGQKRE